MAARLETLRDNRIGASALGCLGFGRGTALPNHPAETSCFCAGNHLGGITPKQGHGIDGFIRQQFENAVAQKGDQQPAELRAVSMPTPRVWKLKMAA